MKILAFDSSGGACSAAVSTSAGRLASHRYEPMERGHAERLMPMIGEVLREAGIAARDLDLVAVAIGPGTFTGIRIALAAARGLALAGGMPVLGVTGFDAVAEAVPAPERAGRKLLVVLDSRRGDAFAQFFDEAGAVIRGPEPASFADLPRWLSSSEASSVRVAGDAATASAVEVLRRAGFEAETASGTEGPDAASVLAIAHRRWRPGQARPPAPRPLYLRAPSVTLAAAPARPPALPSLLRG